MKTASNILSSLMTLLTVAVACAAGQLVTANLGLKGPDFDSAWQAAAILQLIRKKPGATRYEVYYKTRDHEVVFSCDLEEQTIDLTRTYPDGHGTLERWSGHSLYRLENAAGGGSLDNTPEGKLFRTLKTFR
ncbi:MAG: hypothetical protein F9K32_16735 [Desulfobulbaceae bacterium]|nr:MAG: hypothetical protein F9K32_16735 [Desulfobulbaceae bacterium]